MYVRSHGPITALLPFVDQGLLYYNININVTHRCPINSTAVGTAIGLLYCPADPTIREPRIWAELPDANGDRLEFPMARTNYALSIGIWPNASLPQLRPSALERLLQYDGIVGSVGYPRDYQNPDFRGLGVPTVRAADVTDGLGNTIAVMERRSFDTPEYAVPMSAIKEAFTWSSGWLGDSLGCVYTPVNYFKAKRDPYVYTSTSAGLIGASSLHPGGANVAFVDGSVRFLRETMDSWKISPTTGLPPGVTFEGLLRFQVQPGTRIPVYQALGTRNGGEIVSSDDY